MQMSTVYSGTSEYEDERVAVCALLSDLDPINTKIYEAESRAITQNQVIRSGVSQVEENKIYVDEAALRKWANLNLRESYIRYQALRNVAADSANAQLIEAVRVALKHVLPGSVVLELPKNEATDLLVSMLRKLITEFLNNPQHGLDCYLSMRVRHGSLAGHLRNPLEANRVITQREGESDEYKTNDYWLSRLSYLSYLGITSVDQALKRFSRTYDLLIDTYSNEFVQVKSANKPEGLFHLPLVETSVFLLADNILPDTPFDGFLDDAFRYIHDVLDLCLSSVRAHIDSYLRVEADAIFEKLEQQLAELGVDLVYELDAAVHVAHTGLRQSVEDVKLWFYRSEPEKGPEFSFEELVSIGLMCVTRIHGDFSPDLTVVSPVVRRVFQDLNFFSDILFIVFDNIRVHSGKSRPFVHVTGDVRGSDLHVIVRSEVTRERINAATRAKIKAIKETIQAGVYHRAVRSEGGTRLIKLRNILRWSPAAEDSLDFCFDEGAGEFVVHFAIPMILENSPEVPQ